MRRSAVLLGMQEFDEFLVEKSRPRLSKINPLLFPEATVLTEEDEKTRLPSCEKVPEADHLSGGSSEAIALTKDNEGTMIHDLEGTADHLCIGGPDVGLIGMACRPAGVVNDRPIAPLEHPWTGAPEQRENAMDHPRPPLRALNLRAAGIVRSPRPEHQTRAPNPTRVTDRGVQADCVQRGRRPASEQSQKRHRMPVPAVSRALLAAPSSITRRCPMDGHASWAMYRLGVYQGSNQGCTAYHARHIPSFKLQSSPDHSSSYLIVRKATITVRPPQTQLVRPMVRPSSSSVFAGGVHRWGKGAMTIRPSCRLW
jgi:hypothetical protein